MANTDFEFSISGIDDLIKKFDDQAVDAMKFAVAKELYLIAEEIMRQSKDYYVPVDTGNLMSTGHVDTPVISESIVEVQMGYGGPAAPYAVYVHEDLRSNVHWKRPGSGPKYLEIPFRAEQENIPSRIASAIRDAIMSL